jgi:hypothetical protein
MSSALLTEAETTWEATALTPPELAGLIGEGGDLVVKLEIEGGEYALLPALARALDRPDARILVSFHPGILREAGLDPRAAAERVLAALRGWTPYALDSDLAPGTIDADAIERCDVWLFTKEATSAA